MQRPPFPSISKRSWAYSVLALLSKGLFPTRRKITHVLRTRAPLYSGLPLFSLDLHVLGTPPAFVLSQDQTLQFHLSRFERARPWLKVLRPAQLPNLPTEFKETAVTRNSTFSNSLFRFQRTKRPRSAGSQRNLLQTTLACLNFRIFRRQSVTQSVTQRAAGNRRRNRRSANGQGTRRRRKVNPLCRDPEMRATSL